jgi:hypothetical protein
MILVSAPSAAVCWAPALVRRLARRQAVDAAPQQER